MTDTVYRLAFASRFGLIPYVMDMSGPPILCSHRCAGVDMRQDPFHKIHCPGENKTGRNKEHNNFQYSYLELADLCNVPNEKSSKKYAGVDPKDPTKLNKQRPDMQMGHIWRMCVESTQCAILRSSFRSVNMPNTQGINRFPSTN